MSISASFILLKANAQKRHMTDVYLNVNHIVTIAPYTSDCPVPIDNSPDSENNLFHILALGKEGYVVRAKNIESLMSKIDNREPIKRYV